MVEISERIIIDPLVCNGRPIIKGTRIAVATVLEFLSAGDSIEEIIQGYPKLSRKDILACLQYATHIAKHHTIRQTA